MAGWLIGILGIVVLLAAFYFYTITPSLSRKRECMEFAKWNYAHRGLWSEERQIPENSLQAFEAAAEQGYAIELDVQMTRDKELVVFHDDTLERMCHRQGKLSDYTLEELKDFTLGDTPYGIPSFSEVLAAVGGRVPLLIEVKMPGRDTLICSVLNRELFSYSGVYCVESFNSLALRWYREHMPDVIRGQLAGKFSAKDGVHVMLRFLATQLMLNWVGRPDFIAYDHRYADCPGFLINRQIFRTPSFAWTVKSRSAYERTRRKFDTAIFEAFYPEPGRRNS